MAEQAKQDGGGDDERLPLKKSIKPSALPNHGARVRVDDEQGTTPPEPIDDNDIISAKPA